MKAPHRLAVVCQRIVSILTADACCGHTFQTKCVLDEYHGPVFDSGRVIILAIRAHVAERSNGITTNGRLGLQAEEIRGQVHSAGRDGRRGHEEVGV